MKPLDIEREVELTLSCLDRIKIAPAPVGFVERLTRKMIFAEKLSQSINNSPIHQKKVSNRY